MAAPFVSFSIDIVPEPVVPAYALDAFERGPIGQNRSVQLGYHNLDQLLPYKGERDVVHRSNFAKTGELVGRVPADGFRPRVFGVESSLERTTAISALIHPNTYNLECQPRQVVFRKPVDDKKSNVLDFLLTLKSGQRTYLYIKNDDDACREVQARIIEQIKYGLPNGYGFAVITEAAFPPQVRGNNERIFLAKRFPDPEADTRLGEILDDLIDVPEFSVEELVVRGAGPRSPNEEKGRIFDAVLRAIADGVLETNKSQIINYDARMKRL